jgi:hypothetical protein
MSKRQENFIIPLASTEAVSACRSAVESCGWFVTSQNENGLTCQEPTAPLSFTSPVTIEIRLITQASDGTEVNLAGTNFGLGPIQSKHVSSQVEKLHNAILAAVVKPITRFGPQSSSQRNVIINGQRLSDEQIEAAARLGVRIADGDYWYDPIMGAWGPRGGPALGVVQAGLHLGGPLAENASNGNTGVFVNGRHLPLQDLQLLNSVVGTIWPGRYWLDANGNCGFEGGMYLGNIWAKPRPSGGGVPGGILSQGDKTGMWLVG